MIALVLGALRSRAAQAGTVLMLTALAVAAAAASPWYVVAAAHTAAAADVTGAPVNQRMLSIRQVARITGPPQDTLDTFRTETDRSLAIPGLHPVFGLDQSLDTTVGSDTVAVAVAYRDEVCDHLRITGSCPTARDQGLISQYTANALGLSVGDRLKLQQTPGEPPVNLLVVGRYELADPSSGYWADPLFGPSDGSSDSDGPSAEPVFVALDTFGHSTLAAPAMVYDAEVPAALIRGDHGYDLAEQLKQANYRLGNSQLNLVSSAPALLDEVRRDRAGVRDGVLVGATQVLVLCWFALALAGRYTARERRGDVALLKLRGSTQFSVLRLVIGQSLLPMLGGLLIGVPVGYLAARWLTGPVTGSADRWLATRICGLAVLAALLGGLLALAAAELAALRAPVVLLLRRVPPMRHGRRAALTDLVLVVVAVAGIYQARSGGDEQTRPGLALLATPLAALAVAVLLARLYGVLADRGGGWALRTGRLRLGLVALQMSRRPGTDRVFALITLAVALLGIAGAGWSAGSAARTQRASLDVGATRVLTVQAANRTALLRAVRSADPGGRQAMAVVDNPTTSPPVLAVDSSRLAAVALWRPEYGSLAVVSRELAEPVPAPATVNGTGLTLRVRNPGGTPLGLLAQLENQGTGAAVRVSFGAVSPGEHEVSAPVSGCTAAPGCRLVSLQLTGAPVDNNLAPLPIPADSMTVTALGQQQPDRPVLDAGGLGDERRWRGNLTGLAVSISARPDGLTLTVPPYDQYSPPLDTHAFVVAAALPVPVVLAGPAPNTWLVSDPTITPFSGGPVPIRVAGTATALPVLGQQGVLIDLGTAQRVVADPGLGGSCEVWLAPDAPAALTDRLRAAGLIVLGTDSLADHQRLLAAHAPAVTVRFELLTALVGVLLAAAALTVAAAVERDPRAGELLNLRAQGLTGRAAAAIGLGGYAALVLPGVVAGLVTAVLARALADVTMPVFIDGWAVLPVPAGPPLGALTLAGVISLLVLGLTGWAAVAPLIRAVRGSSTRPTTPRAALPRQRDTGVRR